MADPRKKMEQTGVLRCGEEEACPIEQHASRARGYCPSFDHVTLTRGTGALDVATNKIGSPLPSRSKVLPPTRWTASARSYERPVDVTAVISLIHNGAVRQRRKTLWRLLGKSAEKRAPARSSHRGWYVVGLDYSQLNPRLAYALAKGKPPSGFGFEVQRNDAPTTACLVRINSNSMRLR